MPEYIEREAAKRYTCDRCGGQGHCSRPELCQVMSGFDRIPAADVRPVVRGKWTLFGRRGIYGVMYECSACHAKYDGIANFCPNCGADMREES